MIELKLYGWHCPQPQIKTEQGFEFILLFLDFGKCDRYLLARVASIILLDHLYLEGMAWVN
ncbi:MAG: hypothetical protein WBB28_08645 [Crinalium sp.]